ncbi:hypothetical protein, partial [Bacteroides heparinolyticus]
ENKETLFILLCDSLHFASRKSVQAVRISVRTARTEIDSGREQVYSLSHTFFLKPALNHHLFSVFN